MLASTTASNEAFAEHLLSLLALVLPPTVQPVYQNQDEQSPDSSKVDELLSHHLSRSNAELKVEKALLELGARLRNAESRLQVEDQRKNGMQCADGDRYMMGKSRWTFCSLGLFVLPFCKRSKQRKMLVLRPCLSEECGSARPSESSDETSINIY